MFFGDVGRGFRAVFILVLDGDFVRGGFFWGGVGNCIVIIGDAAVAIERGIKADFASHITGVFGGFGEVAEV